MIGAVLTKRGMLRGLNPLSAERGGDLSSLWTDQRSSQITYSLSVVENYTISNLFILGLKN